MHTNISLNTADIIVIILILALMAGGIRVVFGFFHPHKHEKITSDYNGHGQVKLVLQVDGMMCGQCEAHVSDAIRKRFDVKKVSSSHTKGETVIIARHDIPDTSLKEAVESAGYTVTDIARFNA
ncbi:MAG: heavy metal-associated domain-containing protein [Lactimicrobium sp.]|jgi:copper chaperone CopZ|uniref:heavy-metal-associated domain-containing protein n=1 Tax=Lactimicrobium sp. TaxID=2563780 RepID=UPI002F357EC2